MILRDIWEYGFASLSLEQFAVGLDPFELLSQTMESLCLIQDALARNSWLRVLNYNKRSQILPYHLDIGGCGSAPILPSAIFALTKY